MNKTLIIAEAGVNHNGERKLALELIEAAVAIGADAIKFQTFCPEGLVTSKAPMAGYQVNNMGANQTQLDMLKTLELSCDDHYVLRDHAKKLGIYFFSTPFDLGSLDFLIYQLGIDTIKIGSGDLSNAFLLFKAGRTKASVILSTGMAGLGDIEMALANLAYGYLYECWPSSQEQLLSVLQEKRAWEVLEQKLTLLHCTSDYPASFEELNLSCILTLKQAFGLAVGYSDHSLGITIPIAAVAIGASVIEKHLTLNRDLPGPDHEASIEPHEFQQMVNSIRQVEQALGNGRKLITPSEKNTRDIARKSLVASLPIKQGDLFSQENLAAKRPYRGISSAYIWDFLGKNADRAYKIDEFIGTYEQK